MRKITAIILNYNSALESVHLYKELIAFNLEFLHIHIVDNASGTYDKDILVKNIPQENLIFNSSNLGYSGGNKIGVCQALKRETGIILLLNPDIKIDKENFLGLYTTILNNENCLIIGPRICNASNKNEIYSDGGKVMEEEGYYTTHLNSSRAITEVENPGMHLVDYVNGSCLMFDKKLLDEVGFMRDDFFLYFEETEWCLRIRDQGLGCWVNSNYCVYHTPSSKNLNYFYYMTRNRLLLARIRKNFVVKTFLKVLRPVIKDCLKSVLKFEKLDSLLKIKIKAGFDSLKPLK